MIKLFFFGFLMVVHLAEVSDSSVWETTYCLAKTNSPWGMIRPRHEKSTNPVSYTIIGLGTDKFARC